MLAELRKVLIIFGLLTVVTGIAYPLLVTLFAQIAMPHQANGSLIQRDGKTIGSELIGQTFDDPKYFWSRPSATGPSYNGAASTGSNFGPTNPAQIDAVKGRVEAIRKAHPDQSGPVPVDLVTASGSGLDPHVSPAAAEYQVARIARARGRTEDAIRQLLKTHTDDRTFGLLGEPRVNVLMLNLALDKQNDSL
jgi:potassium-transporting ATPase KdpC subunit